VKRRLRALVADDSDDDCTLTIRELRRQGYDTSYVRVEGERALREALRDPSFEIVLSDWSMPSFDALAVLSIVREVAVDLPVVIISGTVGEETAVDALLAGASDFLVKGKLSRLGPAIERELRQRSARAAQRDAETALHASELRFKRLWDSGIVGLSVSDLSGVLLEGNDTLLAMTGHPRADLAAGKLSAMSLTPPEWHRDGIQALARLRAGEAAGPWEQEYLRRDGSRVPVLVATAALEDDRSIAITLDLTERKRLEEQFRQAQKMEAIGALAGGVAHDFNNLLTVILSYAHFVLAGGEATPAVADDVDKIRLAGERAVDLTRQLLAFSRKQMLRPRSIDMNQLVGNMVKLLERVIGESVQLSILPGVAVGTIHADPSQVEQIVMNLAVNARDAMPDGGKLVIETSNVELDELYAARHHDVRAGRYVLLSFEDTGSGIDAATRERMFEPFFTTKEQGKGTGLGLSTVYGIVRQSGGHIVVRSQVGEGTMFEVFLPRSDAALVEEEQPPSARHTLRGTETILLVEDEEQLRVVVRTILRRLGYVVLDASNGGEAFLISQDHRGEIDLMITDVVMPHLSGRVLAERLKAQRPHMKVLFMSGYTDDAVLSAGVGPEVDFLAKPITPEMLARKVRDVLDRLDANRDVSET
jgi:two-component system cell cycle sensor histidine kinase/response regulator CckA